jgi:hypothetical protein
MRARQSGAALAACVVLSIFAPPAVLAQESPDKTGGDSPRWYNPSRYNPLKLLKRAKSANDQLASDGHLEDKLTKQLRLQGILPAETEMQDVCSTFRDLATCIAVLRLTKSLPVEFSCLKWDVTGVKPKSVADSCAGPAGGKAMSLEKAIDLLKPGVDYRKEAKNALGKAHDDIRDASS